MGDLSPHFSLAEFRCRHCGAVRPPSRGLLDTLERLRAIDGRPLPVLSGYRCPAWNRRVGGARHSLHLTGLAADVPRGRFTVAQARASGARGIGHRGGWVVHVDDRAGPLVIFAD